MTSKTHSTIIAATKCVVFSFRFTDYLQKISTEEEHKTLIFAQTKREADRIFYKMSWIGCVCKTRLVNVLTTPISRWPAVCIHGDKSQMQRDQALRG